MRTDSNEDAKHAPGHQHARPHHSPETLFDGATFDPKDPETYAKGFAVKTIKGAAA
jgi:nitrate/nitrite transport system substrate-binding protein